MYDRDMPIIAEHGLATPEGFADVVTFVLLTIQQPLRGVAAQFADVKKRGAKSRYLFGAKRAGFEYTQALKGSLHARVKLAIESGDTAAGIEALLEVPSLGMVKAAFVMQCLGARDAACVDTHNLARFGLKESAFKCPKTLKPETVRNKIRDYLDYVLERGDAAWWWNTWCEYVVNEARRASGFADASECSRAHPRALGLA